ncbi:Pentatricopeptide repeat-containing protein At5g13270, chloroplastic [Linum perenne]
MVDLLGRAGYLDEAWDFIQTMPDAKSDAPIWGAFLGSCRIHGNLEYAEIAARHLYKLEPSNPANYVQMMCLYNVDDDEKVKLLLGHTEKLAITYGLIKRRSCSSNVPIRVIKNTRTCSDCHSVAKLISLAKGCEIILRDGVRFHHFKDGKCSCNDYW